MVSISFAEFEPVGENEASDESDYEGNRRDNPQLQEFGHSQGEPWGSYQAATRAESYLGIAMGLLLFVRYPLVGLIDGGWC